MTPELYSELVHIQQNYPALTFKNVGYENIDRSKLTENEHQADKRVTELLSKHIKNFRRFQNFCPRRDGSIAIRVQYVYDPDSVGFTGVGYLHMDSLLHGFEEVTND